MENNIKILGISGSLRKGSAHHAILSYLASLIPEVDFCISESIEAIPNFNPDLDQPDSVPHPAVKVFRAEVEAANAVIICTPEYAYGIPGALKNALDWTVSSGSFVDKPVGVITASGLGEHAHASLLLVLQALTAKVEPEAALLIPYFKSKMNAENVIVDEETQIQLKGILEVVLAEVNK